MYILTSSLVLRISDEVLSISREEEKTKKLHFKLDRAYIVYQVHTLIVKLRVRFTLYQFPFEA